MQRYTRTLAAGEWFQLPAGTQFFMYELSGAETVTARFIAPDGKQIGSNCDVPQGFRYGSGEKRLDGSDWFQQVLVTNNNALSVQVVIYIAGTGMDLSGVASAVSVAGSVNADVRAASLAASEAQPVYAPAEIDFCVFFQGVVPTLRREGLALASAEGDANFPSTLIIERVEFWGTDELYLEVSRGIVDNSVFNVGSALVKANSFQVFSGESNQLVGGGASTNWARNQSAAVLLSAYDARSKSVAGGVQSWVPPVPILIARGAGHSGANDYFSSAFYLVNMTGANQDDCGMVIYGRQIA